MKTISKPRNGPSPFRGKWESCVCHVTHTQTHISKPRNGPFPFQGKWESCVCYVTHTHDSYNYGGVGIWTLIMLIKKSGQCHWAIRLLAKKNS